MVRRQEESHQGIEASHLFIGTSSLKERSYKSHAMLTVHLLNKSYPVAFPLDNTTQTLILVFSCKIISYNIFSCLIATQFCLFRYVIYLDFLLCCLVPFSELVGRDSFRVF